MVLSCKNRVLFDLTMQSRKLLNCGGFQNSTAQEKEKDKTLLVRMGHLIIHRQNKLSFHEL